MPCGQRVESGVSVPWGDMVGEEVAEGKDAAVTGEYQREFDWKVFAVENVVFLIQRTPKNVRTNGEGRTVARGDKRRAQLVGSEGD